MSDTTTIIRLHDFNGHPAEFWPEFCSFAAGRISAEECLLLERGNSAWAKRFLWTSNSKTTPNTDNYEENFSNFADRVLLNGFSVMPKTPGVEGTCVGQRLVEEGDITSVAIFLIPSGVTCDEEVTRLQLELLADAPVVYQRRRSSLRKESRFTAIAETLDLLLLLNEAREFAAAAMLLVNEVAGRYGCSRVSLGWNEQGYLRLKSISHMERFEPKMELVGHLEAAMEECFDQDVILMTPGADARAVTRDHDEYRRRQQLDSILSLPLRDGVQPVAVLTCERQDGPFRPEDVDSLQLLCDQVATRLGDLRAKSRGLWEVLTETLREKTAGLLGAEHTLLKGSCLFLSAVLILSFFLRVPYRVEAPFILRSEEVRQVTAPYDGYIDRVFVRIGQMIAAQDPLLLLDSRDLELEEAEAVANQIRYLREAEKARAKGLLIDMKIAQAQSEQAGAKLERVRHHLSLAELKAPITGYVVEGDLEQLRGAPVSKGDVLFKLAHHQDLFVEIKVDEQDIHEIEIGQGGEIAFVSRPERKFPVAIELIDPAAVADDAGNVFIVRSENLESADDWWRPGMSGLAKIDVGSRTAFWIFTHRTVDFFQMLMWW